MARILIRPNITKPKQREEPKKKKSRKLPWKERVDMGRRQTIATSQWLQKNPPASEVWFHGEWDRMGMKDPQSIKNQPFGRYIPNVLNRHWFYVIEVDESVHPTKQQQHRDQKKAEAYERWGLSIFRVQAYDRNSLLLCAISLQNYQASDPRHSGVRVVYSSGCARRV